MKGIFSGVAFFFLTSFTHAPAQNSADLLKALDDLKALTKDAQQTQNAPSPLANLGGLLDLSQLLTGGGGSPSQIVDNLLQKGGNPTDLIKMLVGVLAQIDRAGLIPTGPMAERDPTGDWALQRAKDCKRGINIDLPTGSLSQIMNPAIMLGVTDIGPIEQMYDIYSKMVPETPCNIRNFLLFHAALSGLRGDYADATSMFETLDSTLKGSKNSEFELIVRLMYPAFLGLQRRNEDALKALENLRPDVKQLGPNPPLLSVLDGAIGDLKVQLGDTAVAGVDTAVIDIANLNKKGSEVTKALSDQIERGQKAAALFKQALDHFPSHQAARTRAQKEPGIGCTALSGIARVRIRLGQTEQAEQALDGVLGPDGLCDGFFTASNIVTSFPYLTRGKLRTLEGDYDGAEQDLEFALNIAVKLRGPGAPLTRECQSALAELRVLQGRIDDAVSLAQASADDLTIWLGGEVAGAASRAHRRDVVTFQRRFVNLAVEIALHAPDNQKAAELAALAALRFKGIQGEEDAALEAISRNARFGSQEADLSEQISDLRRDLTLAVMAGSASQAKRIQKTTQKLEHAEKKLAQIAPEFGSLRGVRDANVTAVQDTLLATDVLVEFIEYSHKAFGAVPTGQEPSMYAAAIIRKDRVEVVPISDAKAILGSVKALAVILNSKGKDPNWIAKRDRFMNALDKSIHQPLKIDNASRVFLAADGALNAVSFHSLKGEDRSRWASKQNQQLVIIHSGRALLFHETDTANGIVGVGGVDVMNPLPGMLEETLFVIDAFKDRYPQERAELLTGPFATQDNLEASVFSPRVLHIATHAGFDAKQSEMVESQNALNFNIELAKSGSPAKSTYMSALELQSLNLTGTELVVLSACETGTGQIEAGEGLHDLVRSFRVAGARVTIATRRKVKDAEAKAFFIRFYTHWKTPNTEIERAFSQTMNEMFTENPKGDWSAFAILRNRFP